MYKTEKVKSYISPFVSMAYCCPLSFGLRRNMTALIKGGLLSSIYKWFILRKPKHNNDYLKVTAHYDNTLDHTRRRYVKVNKMDTHRAKAAKLMTTKILPLLSTIRKFLSHWLLTLSQFEVLNTKQQTFIVSRTAQRSH